MTSKKYHKFQYTVKEPKICQHIVKFFIKEPNNHLSNSWGNPTILPNNQLAKFSSIPKFTISFSKFL